MDTREIFIAAVLPAALGGVAAVSAWVLAPAKRPERRWAGAGPVWLVPGLVLAGVLLGSYAIHGGVALWSGSAEQRFPALGLVSLIATVPMFIRQRSPRLAATGLAALVAGCLAAWFFIGALHPSFIAETERGAWIVTTGGLIAAGAVVLEIVLDRLPGWRGPALLSAITGTVGLGATANFAAAPMILGGVSAAIGPMVLAGWRHPDRNVLRGSAAMVAVLIGGVVAFSNWLGGSGERWPMFWLLILSPTGAGAALLPWLSARGPWVRLAVAATASLGLAGTMAAIAIPELLSSAAPAGEIPDY